MRPEELSATPGNAGFTLPTVSPKPLSVMPALM